MKTTRHAIQDGIGIVLLLTIGFALSARLGQENAPFAWFAALAVLVVSFGPHSGAHVNPAVSAGQTVRGQLPGFVAVAYVAFHVLGALAYFILVTYDQTGALELSYAETFMVKPPGGTGLESTIVAFGAESVAGAILSFFVCLGISSKTKAEYPWVSPLVVGLGLGIAVAVSSSYSGGSVNPARAIAPVLLAGKWDWLLLTGFVYVLGPVLGATISALMYGWIFDD